MSDSYNSIPLKCMARTIAETMDCNVPEAAAPAVDFAVDVLQKTAGGSVDRAVIYHADAVGMYLLQKHTQWFAPVYRHTQLSIPYVSTVASLTPVAHASMYTGLDPAEHGIRVYERPRLSCDTLYDSYARQGKRSAIIAMPDSTFLHIFENHGADCFEVKDCREALTVAERLIEEDRYDLISIHTFEYDDNAHDFGPESKEALAAVRREIEGFDLLCNKIGQAWPQHRTMVAYAPDHGQHAVEAWEPNPDGYRGDHGSYRTEDMNVVHFYGIV